MQDFDESLLRSLFLRFIHPRLSAIAAGNQNSYNFVCGSRPRINLSLAATVDLSLTSQGVKHSSPLARASHEKRRSSSRELRVWYGVTTERARARVKYGIIWQTGVAAAMPNTSKKSFAHLGLPITYHMMSFALRTGIPRKASC